MASGTVNPRPTAPKTTTASKPAAKPAASTASKSAGGYSGIPATKTTTYGAPAVIAKPASSFTQSLNLYGSPASNAAKPVVNKPVVTTKTGGATVGSTTAFGVPGGADAAYDKKIGFDRATNTYSGGTTTTTTTDKIVISRKPRLDSKGRIIGYDIVYSDGTTGFEPNPDYKPEDATKQKVSNVAYDTIEKILQSYRITGLASVLESIREEYPEAGSDDILTLLQFDDRYNAKFNERFAANVKRQKAGKSVYSPGEYLALEQGFQKVFDSYNLPAFKNQSYYDKFIEGDVDVVDVTDRVQLAYDRVLSDDPVNRAFNQFYSSLGFSDIVAGMLDPVNQLPALQQKVKAAEIGGAALRQGLTTSEIAATEAQANVGYTNVSRGTIGAGVLAGQGVTKAEAEEGYKYVAGVLPTAEKLSSIYGSTEEQYGRLEAEQEKLQGLASAERKRKRISELEIAQFRKDSGLAKGALSSITNI
jgi:hypothetical protein